MSALRLAACLIIVVSMAVIATSILGSPNSSVGLTGAYAAPGGAQLAAVTTPAPASSPAAISSASPVRGLLTPLSEAVLSSEIGGQVAQLSVRDGARFKRGQVLVALDCQTRQSELKKVDAELAEANEQYASNLRLREFKAVSDLQVLVTKLAVDKAMAQRSLVQHDVENCEIKAPFSGRVVKLRVKQYETVAQGQPVVEILDDSNLQVRLLAPSNWLGWLKPQTPFQITIDEVNKPFNAKVSSVGARIDPASQTVEVIASIKSRPGELLAGMSGTATFSQP